jgi:hypothetical protein
MKKIKREMIRNLCKSGSLDSTKKQGARSFTCCRR